MFSPNSLHEAFLQESGDERIWGRLSPSADLPEHFGEVLGSVPSASLTWETRTETPRPVFELRSEKSGHNLGTNFAHRGNRMVIVWSCAFTIALWSLESNLDLAGGLSNRGPAILKNHATKISEGGSTLCFNLDRSCVVDSSRADTSRLQLPRLNSCSLLRYSPQIHPTRN